jgi:peptidoglycan-associated lipoprotein
MLNKKFILVASSLVVLASCGGGKKLVAHRPGEEVKVEESFANAVHDRVFFAYDSSNLSSDSKAILDKQAEWIKAHGGNYVVEGHADERGTREYNLGLGERRANNAKKYLVSKGVDATKLNVVSYGKEKPAVVGHDEAAWGQNRRSVTVSEHGHNHNNHHHNNHHHHKGHHHH